MSNDRCKVYMLAGSELRSVLLVTRPNGNNLFIEYSIPRGASPEEAARTFEDVAERLRDAGAPPKT